MGSWASERLGAQPVASGAGVWIRPVATEARSKVRMRMRPRTRTRLSTGTRARVKMKV